MQILYINVSKWLLGKVIKMSLWLNGEIWYIKFADEKMEPRPLFKKRRVLPSLRLWNINLYKKDKKNNNN